MSEDRGFRESLFIPMCYLYRNAVELAMKEILFEESSYSFQKAIKLMYKKKHSISGLWNTIREDVIKHAQTTENDKIIGAVERYLKQLHDYDAQATRFRYPIDKHLNFYYKNSKEFEVDNVAGYFSELVNFLSSVSMMMSAQNESLAEMRAEHRDDMF